MCIYLYVQVNEFICLMYGFKNLYGLRRETLDSLILECLPRVNQTYRPLKMAETVTMKSIDELDDQWEVALNLIQEILRALRNNAGFHIPRVRYQYSQYNDPVHMLSLVCRERACMDDEM